MQESGLSITRAVSVNQVAMRVVNHASSFSQLGRHKQRLARGTWEWPPCVSYMLMHSDTAKRQAGDYWRNVLHANAQRQTGGYWRNVLHANAQRHNDRLVTTGEMSYTLMHSDRLVATGEMSYTLMHSDTTTDW